MEIRFDGKRALVTGAGKGIGRAIVLALVKGGAEVIAISRTQSDLDSLKEEAQDCSKVQTICLDIGNWEATKEVMQEVGPIDLLVNNAAIAHYKEFGELSEEEVNKVMDINVNSIINITQIIANGMKERGVGGSIVNLSSMVGLFVIPSFGLYCVSKGAVHQLTRVMAAEFGPHQIRVNSVNPTVVRTPMAVGVNMFDPSNETAIQMINRTPLRRFAEPEEVVAPVLFLLSDKASMITGAALPIDGGLGVCFV